MHDTALTVGATLEEAARRWPNDLALVIGDRRTTWSGLLEESRQMARALVGLGVKRGERIGTLMHNCWEAVVLIHASALVGVGLVPFNARYRSEELAYALGFSDVVGLFTSSAGSEAADLRDRAIEALPALADWRDGVSLALEAAPSLRFVADLGDRPRTAWLTDADLLRYAAAVPDEVVSARSAEVQPTDNCITMFSSGTTARPKACMLNHHNIVSVGAALGARFRLTPADRYWDPLPLYHMSTIMPIAACRSTGAAFVGVAHFEAGAALEEIEAVGATIVYPAFPTLMASMIAHPDFPKRDLSRVRAMLNIGPPDLLRRFCDAWPQAEQVSCYGLTEGGGLSVWSASDDDLDLRLTTSGLPIAGTEAKIVDPETLEEKPYGEDGEIWIRGFSVFSGYLKDPEATARVVMPDGWLRTNDLGRMLPSGHVVYRGRIKDMLKIGGENVAAIEIESYLMTHPAIKMAQVVSVPDERLMEVAAAFIECIPGTSLTGHEVVAYCAGKIAAFKIPRYVEFVDEWPMSATKIQKYKLIDGLRPVAPFDVPAIVRAVAG